MKTSLEIFFLLSYCSVSSLKAFQFVEHILDTSGLATLLLATVNTIQGDRVKEYSARKRFQELYLALEQELDLQHGKVLLALASSEELQAVRDLDWPYLHPYRKEVDACLAGNCSEVAAIVQELAGTDVASILSPRLQNGKPSALVPFCAYKGKLGRLGQKLGNFSVPVCSEMKPVVLAGQSCHSITVEDSSPLSGEKTGLVLMLDPVPTRLTDLQMDGEQDQNEIRTTVQTKEGFAKIHLSTLTRYSSSKDGVFTMTTLKQVKGTERFLAQDEETKQCSNQELEACRTQQYLRNVEELCGCLPWSLSKALGKKVGSFTIVPVFFVRPSPCALQTPHPATPPWQQWALGAERPAWGSTLT
jgi:hypothetical protein